MFLQQSWGGKSPSVHIARHTSNSLNNASSLLPLKKKFFFNAIQYMEKSQNPGTKNVTLYPNEVKTDYIFLLRLPQHFSLKS